MENVLNWVIDFCNAVDRENGLGEKAAQLLDLVDVDLLAENAIGPEAVVCGDSSLGYTEGPIANHLQRAQEALRSGDFSSALSLSLAACRMAIESWPSPPYKIPNIHELERQGISDEQICWICGWKDEFGNPDLEKLRKERRSPGRYLNENWVPPGVREHEQRKALLLKKLDALSKRLAVRVSETLLPVPGLSKNSWELVEKFGNLLKAGLSLRKIAAHLGLSYAKTLRLRDQWESLYGKFEKKTESGGFGEDCDPLVEGLDDPGHCEGHTLPQEHDQQAGRETSEAMEPGDIDPSCGDRR